MTIAAVVVTPVAWLIAACVGSIVLLLLIQIPLIDFVLNLFGRLYDGLGLVLGIGFALALAGGYLYVLGLSAFYLFKSLGRATNTQRLKMLLATITLWSPIIALLVIWHIAR